MILSAQKLVLLEIFRRLQQEIPIGVLLALSHLFAAIRAITPSSIAAPLSGCINPRIIFRFSQVVLMMARFEIIVSV
jgi:hypothetical protein